MVAPELVETVQFTGKQLRRIDSGIMDILNRYPKADRLDAVVLFTKDPKDIELTKRGLDTINQMYAAGIPLESIRSVTIGRDPRISINNLRYTLELKAVDVRLGEEPTTRTATPKYPFLSGGERALITDGIRESYERALADGCFLVKTDKGRSGVFKREAIIDGQDYYIRVDIHKGEMFPSDIDPFGRELYPGFWALLKEQYGGQEPFDLRERYFMKPHEVNCSGPAH